MKKLAQKKCIPCEGGVPPLALGKRIEFLAELKDWEFRENSTRLYKKFIFKDFKTPMDLAIKIGDLSEKEWHHPDLKIGWGYLEVEIWTHKIGSLVESDFILAAKIDELT